MKLYGFLELLRENQLNEFNYDLLIEGLIISANYDKAISIINNLIKKLNINANCDMYKGNDRIILTINEDDIYKKKEFYTELLKILNITGYYISNYKKNGKLLKTVDYPTFIKNKLIVYLNKKYDVIKYDKENGENIPEFLYHVTEEDFLKKIEKSGLIPKTKNFIQDHPERIYLFKNLSDCYDFIDNKNCKDPVILKIDVKVLYYLKLYEDPKYKGIEAYYTYDNIQPFALEVQE